MKKFDLTLKSAFSVFIAGMVVLNFAGFWLAGIDERYDLALFCLLCLLFWVLVLAVQTRGGRK